MWDDICLHVLCACSVLLTVWMVYDSRRRTLQYEEFDRIMRTETWRNILYFHHGYFHEYTFELVDPARRDGVLANVRITRGRKWSFCFDAVEEMMPTTEKLHGKMLVAQATMVAQGLSKSA